MTDAADAEPRFRRGAIIRAKYRVERVLGEGGMGVVLLATHLKLEQRVALKVLLPSVEKRAHVQARFAREARAAAKLRNEHVVRVLDVDETEDGVPFLVMEFLVGSDLDAVLLREGPLEPERAADYVLQACEGVAEAHAAGIVHRDLKPSNLFVAKTEDGGEVVKVLDFGIAKALESNDDLSLTATSGVVGSPLYMSPEQLKGSRDVDARTDVWSLGVVLYQLVSAKLPFEATSATALAAVIASEAAVPLAKVRPGLPAAYLEAVDRCLRKDASQRFESVVELARALATLAPGANGSADRVSRVSRAAATRRLSLAATQPEEDAAPEPVARSPRVTAALTEEEERPVAAPPHAAAGQRTDYGSEVVRKPSTPPKEPPRRGLGMAVGAAIVVAAVVGMAMRGRFAPSAPVAAPLPSEAVVVVEAGTATMASPVVGDASATTTASAIASSSGARAVKVAPIVHTKTSPPASASVTPPPSTASPLDIDLK
ncbi:MAG: Protein kinase [Labilithrix sp.]|nr:Protein kinase [Labilithrix sp.]